MGCFWCKSKCGDENPYQANGDIALRSSDLNHQRIINTPVKCNFESPQLHLSTLRNGVPSSPSNSAPHHSNVVVFSNNHENTPENFVNHNSSYVNRCECDVRAGDDLNHVNKCDNPSLNPNHNPVPAEPGIDVLDGEVPGPSHEIFYNKISVREPLSKVLAERALIEHHYTEVDDEGTSCFYEEIAGSTNSSVTYTKISDITNEEANNSQVVLNIINSPTSRPLPPSVESLMVVAESSRSTSPQSQSHQDQSNHSPQLPSSDITGMNDPRICELYAFVDKSAKNKKQIISEVNNVDELYAKVQKNTSHKEPNKGNDTGVSRSGPEVTNEFYSMHNHKSGQSPLPPPPPPPLPPTLNSIPSRSGRTISMYYNSVEPGPSLIPGHSRRHSFGNIKFNLEREEECAIEDPGYEIVGSRDRQVSTSDNPNEPEADPGYEPIRMPEVNHHNMVNI